MLTYANINSLEKKNLNHIFQQQKFIVKGNKHGISNNLCNEIVTSWQQSGGGKWG